ncbi:MAG TPA: PAS domain-containing protein [Desulfomicrobiaceae bacterium]|nr:PAS domain-containing protein [Desulfomicrobiaceae bacterium]
MTRQELVSYYAHGLDAMPELGLILSPEGKILHANRAYALVRGETQKALLGRNIFEFLQEDDQARGRTIQSENLRTRHLGEARMKMHLPDGSGHRMVHWQGIQIPTDVEPIIVGWGKFLGLHGEEPGQEMGFTVRKDGIIEDASRAVCTMCGYDKSEVIGNSAGQFYFSDISRRKIVELLRDQGEIQSGQVTLRCKDGSPRTFWYSAQVIRKRSGAVRAYSGYLLHREFPFFSKLAHEFSRIVDALPDMAWVCGRDHRIVYANDNYLKGFGKKKKQVLGRTEHDFLPADKAELLTRAALRVFEEHREVIQQAVPHPTRERSWLRVIRRPIFDDSGKEIIGMLGIGQDITQPVERENRFMESLRELDGDAILVLDTQGRILRRTAQTFSPTIYGAPDEEEFYSDDLRSGLALLHPDDLPRVRRLMRMVLHEHKEQSLECRIKNRTGSYSVISFMAVYNETVAGTPRMYVRARDISGLAALRRTDRVLDRLKKASGTGTNRDLAEFLNVSPTAVSNAKKNGRIPPEWLISAGMRTGFSVDWLLTGVGEERMRVVPG